MVLLFLSFSYFTENDDGTPKTAIKEKINEDGIPAGSETKMPNSVINKLAKLRTEGNTLDEALTMLRSECVPHGYKPKNWRQKSAEETTTEKMRSLVLTYLFRAKVESLKLLGRDFSKSLYVPEVDPTTGDTIHARADHNHLLKRIAFHTRQGDNNKIDLRKWEEAMKDSSTDLNLPALLGERKQSTADAEKFLSHAVAKFFKQKGYVNEAAYVCTIVCWHESTDGRGLTQGERKKANLDMLNILLDEWMP